MSNSRLVVDGQLLQTTAWDRGMGKYTFQMLRAFQAVYKGDMHIFFNTNLPKNERMRTTIANELAKFTPHELALGVPNDTVHVASLLDGNIAALDQKLQELGFDDPSTAFFIPSLFHWPSATCFPTRTTNVLLKHDIIPLMYHERYFPVMRVEDHLAEYRELFRADHIVTNSVAVADELQVFLGLENERITPIIGATIMKVEQAEKADLSLEYKKPYVLLPTGNDIRKNNKRCVRAFERYCEESGRDLDLVITSFFSPEEKDELRRLSPRVRFTDNVSDDELAWLFKHAEVVLFASESEGLGLPVLDAVVFDRPTVAGDIPVMREISDSAFYFADPYNPADIYEQLAKAFEKPLTQAQKKEYARVREEFSWERTAERFVAQLPKIVKAPLDTPKPRIAVVAPDAGGYSGIGKMVIEMHPSLSRVAEVEYYFEKSIVMHEGIRPNYLPYVAPCYDVHEFNAKRYRSYDAVIYHIGNSENHLVTTQHALSLPGIVVQHEPRVQNIYQWLEKEGMMDKRRIALEHRLDELAPSDKSSCITSLVNAQLGVIVHSNHVRKTIEEVLEGKVAIAKANLPYQNPTINAQNRHRKDIHIGMAGFLAGIKGLELLEEVATHPELNHCIFDVFGFNFAEEGLLERVQALPNVRLSTNLSDQEYQSRLANLDIVLNYRLKTHGESSSVVLESLRYGVVPVVHGIGWFGELPDNVVVKLNKLDQITPALIKLVGDKKLRQQYADAGKRFIETDCLHKFYVNAIMQLVEKINSDQALSRAPLAAAIHRGESLERLLTYVK